MKVENRPISFIFLITIIFLSTSSYAELRVNSEIFKKEAITAEVSIPIRNHFGKAHRNALDIFQKTEDHRKAIEILKKAKVEELLAKSPEQISLTKEQYAAILNDYGYFLYLDKQLDNALLFLERVIEVNPERTVAYLNRGDIYRDKYKQTKGDRYKELYLRDYTVYNGQMIKAKKSYLVPERVEKELYTLTIKDPPAEKEKRKLLEIKILEAAKENRTDEVIRLLEEGAEPNAGGYVAPIRYQDNEVVLYQSQNYETPLFYAVEKNNIEMVKYLINNDAMLRIETLQRNTPLHFAACDADLEMVKYLLRRGAYYSFTNNNNLMPVAWSVGCEIGKYEVFEYLLTLNGGRYINQESLNEMVIFAGKLKDHEKAYRMTRVLFDKFRKKLSKDALGKGYVNAVTEYNKKLIEFYRENRIEIDQNEYIIALLRAKKFKEAKEEIDRAKEINGEVFSKLSLIPLYATDDRCKTGVKYEGTELEELLVSAMKKYDVNWVDPPKFPDIFPHEKTRDYNSYVERFIGQLNDFANKYTSCFDKELVIKVIKIMLENGLKSSFFSQSPGRIYPATFSFIMSLGDFELASRILRQGITVHRGNYIDLFSQARHMEWVKLLESHGFSLTRNEYRQVLEKYEKYPKLLELTDPQVVDYYQSKIR